MLRHMMRTSAVAVWGVAIELRSNYAISQFLQFRVKFQSELKEPARSLTRWHKRRIKDGAHTKTANEGRHCSDDGGEHAAT